MTILPTGGRIVNMSCASRLKLTNLTKMEIFKKCIPFFIILWYNGIDKNTRVLAQVSALVI